MRRPRPTPVPRRRILPADEYSHVSSPFPARPWLVMLSCGHPAHVRNREAKTAGCERCARAARAEK